MRTNRGRALLNNKVKSLDALKNQVSKLKNSGKRIVFTNGCFDLLHYGHVKYLEEAKSKGDVLVVGVNSDASVRKIKGGDRPIVNQKDRVRLIAALASVDFAVLFKEENPLKLIKAIKPDVLIKGADWNKKNIIGSDFVAGYGGKVRTVKLVEGRSTTNLIQRIAKSR